MYEYSQTPSYLSPLLHWLGAFHGVELDSLFGTHDGHAATEEEALLSADMMSLWGEFISGRRKKVVAVGGGYRVEDAGPGGDIPPPPVRGDSFPPQSSIGLPFRNVLDGEDISVHLSDWPLYDDVSQTILDIRTRPLLLNTSSLPSTCKLLWDTTMRGGGHLLSVPPKSSEPLLSAVGNKWVPDLLLSSTARVGHEALLLGAVVVAFAIALSPCLLCLFVCQRCMGGRRRTRMRREVSSTQGRMGATPPLVPPPMPAHQASGERSAEGSDGVGPCVCAGSSSLQASHSSTRKRRGIARGRHDELDEVMGGK